MELIKQIWKYAKNRKKFWLLPIFLFLVLLGLILVVGQGSVITPFIYALF